MEPTVLSQKRAETRMGALLLLLKRHRFFLPAILLAGSLMLCASIPCAGQTNPRRRVILVLCDCLTFDDFHDRSAPFLAHLAEQSAIGLMNCAVRGAKTPAAATLTVAIGQHQASEPSDEQAFNDWETVPGDLGVARAVYVRRAGTLDPSVEEAHFDPERAVKHLGIVSLLARGLDADRLGSSLARAKPPVRAYVCGNADKGIGQPRRRAALLTADTAGICGGMVELYRFSTQTPYGLCDDPRAMIDFVVQSHAEFLVLQMGDFSRAEDARPGLSDAAYHRARLGGLQRLDLLAQLLVREYPVESGNADVILVSPRPPSDDAAHLEAWGRLAPILAYGPDFPPGALTSPTTRTTGLVANIDIAPTLLQLFHVPAPIAMIGRPMEVRTSTDGVGERIHALAHLNRLAALNGKAEVDVMLPIGVICFCLLVTAIYSYRRKGPRASRRFGAGIVFVQNMGSAVLFAPLLAPASRFIYGIWILAWMVILTLIAYGVARALKLTPPVAAAALCVLLIGGDTLAGQPLLKDSVFSAYALSGIRYYGVGNEYLGIVVGFAILGVFAWLDDQGKPPPMRQGARLRWAAPGIWMGIAFLLGWPTLGANAGSLIVTAAGFGVAAAMLHGRKPSAWMAIACGGAGLLLAFVFGTLEATFAESTSSHIGQAIHASASGRGAGYLFEIALRKIQMNLRLLVSPWLLLGAAAVIATAVTARCHLGEPVAALFRGRPWMALGHYAVAAAMVAGLLFKDSGVVMATYLAGVTCLMDLYYLLTAPGEPA